MREAFAAVAWGRDVSIWVLGIAIWLAAGQVGAASVTTLPVDGGENGATIGSHLTIWHDPSGLSQLADAASALERQKFGPAPQRRSTGLLPGTLWGFVSLSNATDTDLTLHLEYPDHQLIYLNAFARVADVEPDFGVVANLSMSQPFDQRPVAHHRFVVPVTVPAGATLDVLVEYGSEIKGFVFPDLRIWAPEALKQRQAEELAGLSFLVGGLVLMALVALTVGISTGERLFYVYSIYALTKVGMWWTMVGFTHQFLMPVNFHWSYMSINGALVIAAGIWFARLFLQSRQYIPRFDRLLQAMLWMAVGLVVAAVTHRTDLAVSLITVLLLMYPLISIAGVLRWLQGAREAGVFALAWTFLVAGLVWQALRDLGHVDHSFVSYYWPALGSYTEMVVILLAMGMGIRNLQREKDEVEQRHLAQLRNRQVELEALVKIRTQELEEAKLVAEAEARTDALTGANNRRNFFRLANQLLSRSRHRDAPFSALMLDLDFFKAINDHHGHMVGDKVLKVFAEAVMAEIRDTDVFARLGGEEFVLLLTGPEEAAEQIAERLRSLAELLPVETEAADPIRFTASIGVAHFAADNSVEELLGRADSALYRAKQNGRNRVEVA